VVHPEDEEMTSYSEEEIRYAFRGWMTESSGKSLLRRLHNNREKSVLSDDDTVTVRELRETLTRMFPDDRCQICGAAFHGGDKAHIAVLDDIFSHREPKYPYGTVWKDDSGVHWQRATGDMWLRMGQSGTFSHTYPKRPLKRMDVI